MINKVVIARSPSIFLKNEPTKVVKFSKLIPSQSDPSLGILNDGFNFLNWSDNKQYDSRNNTNVAY